MVISHIQVVVMKKRTSLLVATVLAILSILDLYDSGLFVLNRRPLRQLVDNLSSKDDKDELSIPE